MGDLRHPQDNLSHRSGWRCDKCGRTFDGLAAGARCPNCGGTLQPYSPEKGKLLWSQDGMSI